MRSVISPQAVKLRIASKFAVRTLGMIGLPKKFEGSQDRGEASPPLIEGSRGVMNSGVYR